MSSLVKLLAVIFIFGGLIGGGILALASYVEPTPREMVISIPSSDLK